jgi:hypothetical protein
MNSILTFSLPKFTLIGLIIKKPTLLVTVIPVVVATKLVVDFEGVGWLLFWLFVGDLITGLGSSYVLWKESDHKDRWFFGKGEGFSSDKAKKMGVKLAVYLVVPYMLIQIQKLLFLKNFKYERVSAAEFEWATISLIVFCLIEGFSIFHENLPKMGFDLWGRIREMIGFYKTVKNEISE